SSWGLSYNLYGDKLLGLILFSASVYIKRTNLQSLSFPDAGLCSCSRKPQG
ncbi:hypothetical protein K438DRAFT_1586596, partial [Mycena galopus ATCC 62051]